MLTCYQYLWQFNCIICINAFGAFVFTVTRIIGHVKAPANASREAIRESNDTFTQHYE